MLLAFPSRHQHICTLIFNSSYKKVMKSPPKSSRFLRLFNIILIGQNASGHEAMYLESLILSMPTVFSIEEFLFTLNYLA